MTSVLENISAIYSIFIGIAIIGLWIMLILKKQIPELKTEPISIYFHISAEMSMGIMAILSGILILIEITWGKYLFLISSGICIYSVINSAGYYAQRKKWMFVGLFAFILLTSVTLSCFTIASLILSS